MKTNNSTTLRNICFNLCVRYRKLIKIGKGKFFEINKINDKFIIQRKEFRHA